ncbi:hypothetical protein [Ferruginibacter sp.]
MTAPDQLTKLSSAFILQKILFITGLLICLLLLQDYNRVSAKDSTSNIIAVLAFTAGTIYFFTRPVIFFDDTNLYIKKFRKKEIVIPLKNIRSLEKEFFYSIFTKGGNYYHIKYAADDSNGSIRFYAGYGSDSLPQFIVHLKKINRTAKIET